MSGLEEGDLLINTENPSQMALPENEEATFLIKSEERHSNGSSRSSYDYYTEQVAKDKAEAAQRQPKRTHYHHHFRHKDQPQSLTRSHGHHQQTNGHAAAGNNNANGERGSLLNPMIVVGVPEEEHYSSSSPFHSATEDFGGDNDGDRDRDPLIKPPAKTSQIHQLLSSKLKKQSSCDSTSIHTSTSDQGDGKRKCSMGILLAAASCIFFATSALIVKVSKLHPMELLAFRGLVQGILITPLVISSRSSLLPKGSMSLLFARATLGSVALVMSFASIHWIPLADAATVIFTSPVFVSIFACVCLSELCTWFDVAMIAMTLLGVLLVSQPTFDFVSSGSWTNVGGIFCGLAAAMLTALAFIVLRQLKHVHYSVTVFWFSFTLASFGAVLTTALDGFVLPTDFRSIVESIGIGICGFFGQILLTKALQLENAGPVAVARTMDIVLAFFYQITLLHDTPDWKSYLGSALVVLCVLLTAFRRWYRERNSGSEKPSCSGSSAR